MIQDHTSLVYNDKMWVIGGNSDGIWNSTDGQNWSKVIESGAFGSLSEHASFVHDSKIWLFFPSKGELWNSTDGENWVKAADGLFTEREMHKICSFNNKLWISGGRLDRDTYLNDLWYSDNGVDWKLDTDSAQWSLRGGHFFFPYADKMWILGGQYRNFAGGWVHLWSNDVWSSDGQVSIRQDYKSTKSFQVFDAYNRLSDKVVDINFVLDKPSLVNITVYNSFGQKMRVLMNDTRKNGNYSIKWDRKCALGKIVPSGSYYVSFGSQGVNRTVKVVLIN